MEDQHLTIHWPLIGMSLDDARRYGCRCPRRKDIMKAETRIYMHLKPPPHPSLKFNLRNEKPALAINVTISI